jgi:hypothetical protein
MTDVGPAEGDGQRAIHLMQSSAKTGEIDMWVDPATYLCRYRDTCARREGPTVP